MKRLIAEFEKQSFVQMVFPHEKTDWSEYLEEARANFVAIVNAIRNYEPVLLICHNIDEVRTYFQTDENITFVLYESDDTWARDISAISVKNGKQVELCDFVFNAWGGKFEAAKDNGLTKSIQSYYKCPVVSYDFILEGGAIETNAKGLLLTTAECMLNKNRNPYTQQEITSKLQDFLGINDVVYLQNGYLAGDDTDSHIDTLVRFVDETTLMYLKCDDRNDEHYDALCKMESELEEMAKKYGLSLIALPFCDEVWYDGERLPATYANFLMINGAVLVPLYGVKQDEDAMKVFQNFFTDRDVIGVDCSVLIRQHGSLHCVTMQFHCVD